jgi:hypothetical protein
MSHQSGVACHASHQTAVATPEMVHRSVGISSADSIKVAVRVRPLTLKEVSASITECVQVAEVCLQVFLCVYATSRYCISHNRITH